MKILAPLLLSSVLVACAAVPSTPPTAADNPAAPPARTTDARRGPPPSAPPNAPAARAGAETPTPAGENIHFAANSVRIDDAGKHLLRETAKRLRADPRADVTLVGHSDDLGSTELNIALAQRRVEAVAAELVALGVSPRQVRRISYGNEAASQVCTTAACRQSQRRVEIRYSE